MTSANRQAQILLSHLVVLFACGDEASFTKGLIKYSSNVRRKPGEAFSIQKQTETWVGLFSKYYKTRISRSGGPIRRASITSNGLILHLTSRAAKSILKSRKGGNSSIATNVISEHLKMVLSLSRNQIAKNAKTSILAELQPLNLLETSNLQTTGKSMS